MKVIIPETNRIKTLTSSWEISLILYSDAPIIKGIDNINEYFAANSLSSFLPRAIVIVSPDLEIPGIIAIAWANPINIASTILTSFISFNSL